MPLSQLNQEQYNAATCSQGYNLVIASAGTGKTSTIVGRIGHLLKTTIRPEEILLLTFTNKAAMEMIERVSKYFGQEKAQKIKAGTFHSISFKLLKEREKHLTLKQPNELKTLFKSLYEKRVFPVIDSSTSPYDGGYLYDLYSLYLNSHHGETFPTWLKNRKKEHEPYSIIYEDLILEFNDLKTQYNYVDFNDLLLTMITEQHTSPFTFKEILVDEYQDTNPLQARLLNSFHTSSIFCVGDYDQSIYAFNGADINIIGSFKTSYPSSNIFSLEKNYRSTQPILNLANEVIKNNERIYPKQLKVIREDIVQLPKLLAFNELFEQYEHIANLINKSQTPKDDIAIIFRNNASADGIEANLREYNIPAKRKGGQSFFDAREVKFILDIVTLLNNTNDMMAFIHIGEYAKGLGKATCKDLFDALIKVGHGNLFTGLFNPDPAIKNPYEKSKSSNIQLGLFDDIIELGSLSRFKDLKFDETFLGNPIIKHPKLSKESGQFLYNFYQLLKRLKTIESPRTIIQTICESQLFLSVQTQLITKRSIQKDGSINPTLEQKARTKLQHKVLLLKKLSTHYKESSKFLNAMILGGSEMSEGSGVHLLSIHASKGLEFKEVYIIDLMEGRFPNKKLMQQGGSLEEERRLFYVAVTRAKDILYLSYAQYDKIKKIDFIPSIFLKEAGLTPNSK